MIMIFQNPDSKYRLLFSISNSYLTAAHRGAPWAASNDLPLVVVNISGKIICSQSIGLLKIMVIGNIYRPLQARTQKTSWAAAMLQHLQANFREKFMSCVISETV